MVIAPAAAVKPDPAAAPPAKPPVAAPAAKPAAVPAAKPPAAVVPAEVTPEVARKYLSDFAIDPASVEALEDDQVLELHGKYQEKFGQRGTWPDDWREQLIGSDEKLLKRMQRYASPRDVANALIAAQNRISSGELRSALKEGATEEEQKAWRAENGIPEKPEDYDLALPGGIVFGEEDKPIIDDFVKAAHSANFHPNQVKAALAWYHADREKQIEAMAARDAEHAQAANDELHKEWGNDYRRNANGIDALLNSAPAGVKEAIMSARDKDDRALFNNVGFLRWLDQLRREVNPAATLVGHGGDNIAQTIETELAELTKMMGNKKSAYWKGANAEKNQARYRELIDAKTLMESKGKKAA